MAFRSPLKIAPYQMLTCSSNKSPEHTTIVAMVWKALMSFSVRINVCAIIHCGESTDAEQCFQV